MACTPRNGPLAGIKVLDLTSVIMGPYCTQILADLGAEVIKIESPSGDTLRAIPPARTPGNGACFRWLNRGKRSVVLDLKQPEARDALLELAREADVFVHSMRPQAIARLRLEHAAFEAVNPALVYCNLYGFGRGGRYAGMAAYDDTIQAACGLARLQEEMLGQPSYVASVVADKVCGLTGAYAIMAALLHRERGGPGQEVDVPMFETMASFMLVEHLGGQLFTPPTGRPVYARATSPARRPYPTRDGFISVLVYNDKQWQAFTRLVDRPDLGADPRFCSLQQRSLHVEAWCNAVAAQIAVHETAHWLERLPPIGVPAMALNRTDDLFTDPHLQDVGFFAEVPDARDGPLRMPRSPVVFQRTPAPVHAGGPTLGQDTEHVLASIGLSPLQIQAMHKRGVIGVANPDHAAQKNMT